MLISSAGHIKLTDFGLSRMGLVDKQEAMRQKRTWQHLMCRTEDEQRAQDTENRAQRSGSFNKVPAPKLQQQATTPAATSSASASSSTSSLAADGEKSSSNVEMGNKIVGTPDYLAPEVFLGTGYGPSVDWFALGCICYEFLVGITPFYGDTVEEVMELTLDGTIDWHEEDGIDVSSTARDLIAKLLALDPSDRLGNGGAHEVKAHPWFDGVEWDTLSEQAAQFVPKTESVSDTSYFDARNEVWSVDDNQDYYGDASDASAVDEATDQKFKRFSFVNVELLQSMNRELFGKQ
jgi:serine/threonine-protein kinase RIM15